VKEWILSDFRNTKKVKNLESQVEAHKALNQIYKGNVKELKDNPKKEIEYVAIIPPKNDTELAQYLDQIAQFSKAPWYVSFLDSLKRVGVEGFVVGKESPDYWRGWLAVIRSILDESRNASVKYVEITQRGSGESEV
jgi:hypothetical protein